MAKQIIFAEDARAKIKSGIDQMAKAVRVTLGPKGRSVVIEKKFGSPLVIDDGVTIAKEIELEDKFENMGAQLIREVASKTNDVAGDGTTTPLCLRTRWLPKASKTSPPVPTPPKSATASTRQLKRLPKTLKKSPNR